MNTAQGFRPFPPVACLETRDQPLRWDIAPPRLGAPGQEPGTEWVLRGTPGLAHEAEEVASEDLGHTGFGIAPIEEPACDRLEAAQRVKSGRNR